MRTSDENRFREFAREYAAPLRRSAFLVRGDWHTADDLFRRLVSDKAAADGARIRVYREKSPAQPMLAVVRFGPDGMITEDQLTALVTDPELRFPLPR